MTSLDDPAVSSLLGGKNVAIISTQDESGAIHSAVVWINVEDGKAKVNGAVGRLWTTHLESNPTIAALVYDQSNPFDYVEIRGTAHSVLEGSDDHIDRLAKKYLDLDAYPFRSPAETRIQYVIDDTRVRHQKQG
jgi:PPOX class probable F420-dependent enzyme